MNAFLTAICAKFEPNKFIFVSDVMVVENDIMENFTALFSKSAPAEKSAPEVHQEVHPDLV